MARPRRRILVGGVAAAFLTVASALQPALRVRTPALARAFLVPGYSLQRAKFGEYVVHIPAEHFVRIY